MFPTMVEVEGGNCIYEHYTPRFEFWKSNQKSSAADFETVEQGFTYFEAAYCDEIQALKSGTFKKLKSEFKTMSLFLPRRHHAYHAQIYLFMNVLRPDAKERLTALIKALSPYRKFLRKKGVSAFLNRVMFNTPHHLLKGEIESFMYWMFSDGEISKTHKDYPLYEAMYGKDVWTVLQKEAKDRRRLLKQPLARTIFGRENIKQNSKGSDVLFGLSAAQITIILSVPAENRRTINQFFVALLRVVDVAMGAGIDSVPQIMAFVNQASNMIENPQSAGDSFGIQETFVGNFSDIFLMRAIRHNMALEASRNMHFKGQSVDEIRRIFALMEGAGGGGLMDISEEKKAELKGLLKSYFENSLREASEDMDQKDLRQCLVTASNTIRDLTEAELDDIQKSVGGAPQRKPEKRKPKAKGKFQNQPPATQDGAVSNSPPATPPVQTVLSHDVDEMAATSLYRYVMESLSAERAALEILFKKCGYEGDMAQKTDDLFVAADELVAQVLSLLDKKNYTTQQVLRVNRQFDRFVKAYETLTSQCQQRYFSETKEQRNQGKYAAHLNLFVRTVETHMAGVKLEEAYNRGETLSVAPTLDMAEDIRKYFHQRALINRREAFFIRGRTRLHDNEMFAYHVTNRRGKGNRWFCISVHRWRLNENITGEIFNRNPSFLNAENWRDQDKYLGNAFYVLHIRYP